MPDNKTVGDRIKALREKKNYSQETLAKMIGVAVSTICMYETGERSPRDDIKVKIANALGKSVNYIFLENKVTNRDKINSTPRDGERCVRWK